MVRLTTENLLSQSRMLIAEANRVGAAFCVADLDMAHTLLDRADISGAHEVRERNIGNARHAHDAIRQLRGKLDLNASDAREVEEALQRLGRRLASYS